MTETRREQPGVQARQPGLGEVSQQCPISEGPHNQDCSGIRKLVICLQMQTEWAALEFMGSGVEKCLEFGRVNLYLPCIIHPPCWSCHVMYFCQEAQMSLLSDS